MRSLSHSLRSPLIPFTDFDKTFYQNKALYVYKLFRDRRIGLSGTWSSKRPSIESSESNGLLLEFSFDIPDY